MPIVLVRHAAVERDPAQPAALWPLSDAGRAAARLLARLRIWDNVVRIFTSPELKAHETAQIIAGPNGITVTVVADLREVERPPHQWFDDYPAAVAAWFEHPMRPEHGWESAAAAQTRISACIEQLRAMESGPFAVAGHGLTLSLFIASITGAPPMSIWPSILLPDLAVVDLERRVVVKEFGSAPGAEPVE